MPRTGIIKLEVSAEGPRGVAEARSVAAKALEDGGWLVLNQDAAMASDVFTVHGVNTETGEPFKVIVEAEDEDAAADSIEGPNVVANVVPGEPPGLKRE